MRRHLAPAILLAVTAAACGGPPAAGPTVAVKVGSKTYRLEVAADDAAREHGLMERDAIAADGGMVFVFPTPRVLKFWMHHTRFDLDIVYLDAAGRVVSVHAMKAYDEGSTVSGGPAVYAIELSAGQAAACGVKAGDRVTIPAGVPAGVE